MIGRTSRAKLISLKKWNIADNPHCCFPTAGDVMNKLALAAAEGASSTECALRCSDRATEQSKAGRPYSEELKSRVVAAIEKGASYRAAAAHYGVSASAVLKWTHRFRQTGSIAAKPMGGDRRSRLKSHREWIARRIAADPGLTVAQLRAELQSRGVRVGHLTLRRFIKREKLNPR
jgi:transposase